MKCFQIEIKYINENEQVVGVTIVSDPIPIVADINKDNENEVISDVLNYIYNNPQSSGYDELMSVLDNATSMNQINMYDRPLTYTSGQPIAGLSNKALSPFTVSGFLNKMPGFDNYLLYKGLISNKDIDSPFKLKIAEFPKGYYIDPKTKEFVKVAEDNPLTGEQLQELRKVHYNAGNNTIYVSADRGNTIDQKEYDAAILNYAIAGKYKDSIETIVKDGLDFNPLDVVPAEHVNSLLNILASFKPQVEGDTKTPTIGVSGQTISKKNLKAFLDTHANPENLLYAGPIEGEAIETFANPFSTTPHINDPIAYWAWLNDIDYPLRGLGFKPSGDQRSDIITDYNTEQKDYIDAQIKKGLVRNKTLTYAKGTSSEFDETVFRDMEILQNYIDKDPTDEKFKADEFVKALKGLIKPGKEYMNVSKKVLFKGVDTDSLNTLKNNFMSNVRNLRLDEITKVEADFMIRLADAMNYNESPVDFADFVNNNLPDEYVKQEDVKKSSASVTFKVGDVVEYADNTYLLWGINASGKAKLLKPDGIKYSGTPALDKLKFLSSRTTFKFNGVDYTNFGGNVISLATGGKIKHRKILELAALEQQKHLLSIGDSSTRFSKRVTQNSITYTSDRTNAYDSHVKYLKQINADPNGVVVKVNDDAEKGIYETEQIYYDTILKFGRDAVSNLTYFTDPYGKRGVSFKMATPTLSQFSEEDLKQREDREREFKNRLLNNNASLPSKNWDELSDAEKDLVDSERFTKEKVAEHLGEYEWISKEGYDNSAKIYFRHGNTLTAESILEMMHEEKGNVIAKMFLDRFSDILKGVDVRLSSNKNLNEGIELSNPDNVVLGMYKPSSREVVLADFDTTTKELVDLTILHELLHAISYDHLRKDTEANRQFNELYQSVKNILPDVYALHNVDEFLVGIYTDRNFQTMLKNTGAGEKTLFGRIFDFFSKMLNFDPSFRSNLLDLFSSVLNLKHSKDNLFNTAQRSAMNVLDDVESTLGDYKPAPKNSFKSNPNKSFRSSEDYANGALFSITNDKSVVNPNKLALTSKDRTDVKQLSDYLSATYGLPVDFLNSNEIDAKYSKGGVQYGRHRAFVEDGAIVINSDYATVGEPIHELSHLILDGLKVTNRPIYDELLTLAKTHPTYNYVRRVYPELTGDQIAEETFTTILGERYSDASEPFSSQDWNEKNPTFYEKLIKAVKDFFIDLFGIDSHRFHALQDLELMNLDLGTILDTFANKVINGDFIKEVEVATRKDVFMKNNEYLKAPDGGPSSLHMALTSSGISDEIASKLWIKSKTQNFYNWHRGDIVEEFDGEPRIFYRGDLPNVINAFPSSINDAPVVVKGNSLLEEISPSAYKTASVNIRSVYNLDNGAIDSFRYTGGVENYATLNNIKLIGTPSELKYSISKLKEIFADHTFAISSFAGTDFIEHYKSPIKEVAEMRDFLLKNSNNICA